jgi:hypothetical protein
MSKSLYLLLSSVPLIGTPNLWGLQSPVFPYNRNTEHMGAAKAIFSDENMFLFSFKKKLAKISYG